MISDCSAPAAMEIPGYRYVSGPLPLLFNYLEPAPLVLLLPDDEAALGGRLVQAGQHCVDKVVTHSTLKT